MPHHFALAHLINQIGLWRQRIRDRRHLGSLDAHTLRDMGLTCARVAREARRPFWRSIDLRPE